MEFGLTQAIVDQIVEIITMRKFPQKIIIFGSRGRQDFKKTSDIDIAVIADNFTDTDINIIKDRLEESVKTPLKFDVLDFNKLAKAALRNKILQEGKIIYEHTKN